MQSYSLATIVSGMALLFLFSYAMQPHQDTTLRVAYITSTKPDVVAESAANPSLADAGEELASVDRQEAQVVEVRGTNLFAASAELEAAQNSGGDGLIEGLTTIGPELTPTLPPEYDQFTPTVELNDETRIGELIFSTTIDEVDLIALSPERVFNVGSYTIYATFDYEGMADGMVWSWVWRRDGQVVSGGNELWNYGDEGPGYVYYNPREGFSSGEYTLEIWLNGELFSEANLFMTNDIAATR